MEELSFEADKKKEITKVKKSMQADNIKVSIILPVYNVEEYLVQTLESFREQTLEEFEVIMIDDGSVDASAEIMRKYAAEDERFKCFFQENKGVSATRNRGMMLAQGEYIAFYDADDWIRETVLEKMYGAAKIQKADIVVGRMREFSVAGESIYAETKTLAQKEEISKFDYGLIWNLSLANKLFCKKFIADNGFLFENIAYSEDGLFLMHCVSKAQKIAGCSVVAYEYRKRPLWSGRSVTQQTNEKLFADFIYAHEGMIKVMDECLDKEINKYIEDSATEGMINELRATRITYIAELYYKLEVSIIDAFYRQLWQADDATERRIIDKFEEYKGKVFSRQLDKLIKNNRDLCIEEGLQTKAQIKEETLSVTVAITSNVSTEYINSVLYSIYSQTLISYEIFVQKNLYQSIDESYKDKANLQFIDALSVTEYKNEVLNCANGEFINIIDENILLRENTLKNMYFSGINTDCGFVTVPIRKIDDGYAEYMECNKVLYTGRYRNDKLPFNISLLDNILGNKLLNIRQLTDKGFSFSDNVTSDIKWFYDNLECKKRADLCVFSYFDENFLLSRTGKLLPNMSYRFVRKLGSLSDKDSRRNFVQRLKLKASQAGRSLRDVIQKYCIVRNRVFFYTPRSNKVLLENSKAVYDALDCKKVVFAKKGKHSKLEQWKVKYYLFTSKVIVTDDYCDYLQRVELKPKQKLVQIWHACGAFKKFGLDSLLNDIQKERAIHGQYDVVCVSSENIRADYAGAFGIGIDKVQALGIPRTDLFYDDHTVDELKKQFYAEYPQYQNKKIILYCPTFREKNEVKVANEPQIEWDEFSEALPENAVMLIKNHPVVTEDLLDGRKYPNIANTGVNTNILMMAADIMITDYSSVIFECSILNKPIIFYCPDYEEYERDFYLEFLEDTYGDFTVTQEELTRAIIKNLEKPNLEKLAEFKEKYMGACDGHSTEHVVQMIKELMSEKTG